jgi:hypothetical protein
MSDPVERLRAICLALPEVTERLSHDTPCWFVRDKRVVAMLDDHHHDTRHLAAWIPAAPGAQAELIEQEPERFFRPPYFGVKGWVGVRIDLDVDWDEIAALVEDSFRLVAPKADRRAAVCRRSMQ